AESSCSISCSTDSPEAAGESLAGVSSASFLAAATFSLAADDAVGVSPAITNLVSRAKEPTPTSRNPLRRDMIGILPRKTGVDVDVVARPVKGDTIERSA